MLEAGRSDNERERNQPTSSVSRFDRSTLRYLHGSWRPAVPTFDLGRRGKCRMDDAHRRLSGSLSRIF